MLPCWRCGETLSKGYRRFLSLPSPRVSPPSPSQKHGTPPILLIVRLPPGLPSVSRCSCTHLTDASQTLTLTISKLENHRRSASFEVSPPLHYRLLAGNLPANGGRSTRRCRSSLRGKTKEAERERDGSEKNDDSEFSSRRLPTPTTSRRRSAKTQGRRVTTLVATSTEPDNRNRPRGERKKERNTSAIIRSTPPLPRRFLPDDLLRPSNSPLPASGRLRRGRG
jgi:hypothetical protein